MKTKTIIKIMPLLLAAVLWSGCGKSQDAQEGHEHDHEGHAGHDHGKPNAAAAVEKCPHAAPKSLCFICNPALREKGRLWCEEHARYEDRCWLCHPELEDKKRLYCKEHS